jgi:hypothetical protein
MLLLVADRNRAAVIHLIKKHRRRIVKWAGHRPPHLGFESS